jgi:hypothetical protein
VTVLGLVCEKMSERVVVTREEEEDRRTRQKTVTVSSLYRLLNLVFVFLVRVPEVVETCLLYYSS